MTQILFLAASPPEEILYGYGPLGVFAVGLAYIAYKMFNILISDRDKAIADRDALLQDVFTKILPAVTRNIEFLEARQEIDQDLVHTLKESNECLKDNTKTFEEIKYVLRHGGTNHRVGGT